MNEGWHKGRVSESCQPDAGEQRGKPAQGRLSGSEPFLSPQVSNTDSHPLTRDDFVSMNPSIAIVPRTKVRLERHRCLTMGSEA
jgi:hypothetical protein